VDTPKNPDIPQPLAAREKIEGDMFGQAVMMLADPFVVNVLCKSLARKLDEVGGSVDGSGTAKGPFCSC